MKTEEEKWQKIIEKGCEYEYHPQQDICFCKLNVGYICWWENCPKAITALEWVLEG